MRATGREPGGTGWWVPGCLGALEALSVETVAFDGAMQVKDYT